MFLLFIGLGLIVLDRITKWFVLGHPNLYQGGLLELKLFKNSKLYFWSLNPVFLYLVMGLILIALIVIFLKTLKNKNQLLTAGLLLIILGGLSNLIDRIFLGYVVDWIRVFFLPISIFNIADIMIVGGLTCLIFHLLKS